MADSRCFVQFPHPGGEHRPGPGGHAAWNTLAAPHARKFMQARGEWIEADGSTRRGDLWTWGEWEAQSHLLRRLDGPMALGYPRYLWRPYYVIPNAGCGGLHNTDPFIFGDRFLYSNCKQLSGKRIRRLARGSVIAFGSLKAGQWVLDTVLVVADFVDYAAAQAPSALAGHVPEAFLDVTGGPLADNGRDAKCAPESETQAGCGGGTRAEAQDSTLRLYRGATPKDPVHGMFSFFPAMPEGGTNGFPRPRVDLPRFCFTQNLPRGHKLTSDLDEDTLHQLWEYLVAQVRDADLVVGSHAALPQRRDA